MDPELRLALFFVLLLVACATIFGIAGRKEK